MTASVTATQRHLTNWMLRRVPSGGVRRVAPLFGALATDIGLVRENNQDRVAVLRSRDYSGQTFAVAAVADGIGGMRDGALCASIAIGHLFGKIVELGQAGGEVDQWLKGAVSHSNAVVYDEFHGAGGSTLVVLLIHESGKVFWSSVGDSRVYLASNGELTQLSTDDTIAGQLKRSSDPSHEQSKLLQFIGIGEGLEVHLGDIPSSKGSKAILTSDGVHYLASAAAGSLNAIVTHSPDVATCVRRLIDLSRWCGGPDNASVVALPLDFNFSNDPAPNDRCIEVWDSFGEVRFLVEEVLVRHQESMESNRAQQHEVTTEKSESASETALPDQKRNIPAVKKKATRTNRKSRAKSKVKTASKEHGDDSETGEGEGKFQLEFQSKPE